MKIAAIPDGLKAWDIDISRTSICKFEDRRKLLARGSSSLRRRSGSTSSGSQMLRRKKTGQRSSVYVRKAGKRVGPNLRETHDCKNLARSSTFRSQFSVGSRAFSRCLNSGARERVRSRTTSCSVVTADRLHEPLDRISVLLLSPPLTGSLYQRQLREK